MTAPEAGHGERCSRQRHVTVMQLEAKIEAFSIALRVHAKRFADFARHSKNPKNQQQNRSNYQRRYDRARTSDAVREKEKHMIAYGALRRPLTCSFGLGSSPLIFVFNSAKGFDFSGCFLFS